MCILGFTHICSLKIRLNLFPKNGSEIVSAFNVTCTHSGTCGAAQFEAIRFRRISNESVCSLGWGRIDINLLSGGKWDIDSQ